MTETVVIVIASMMKTKMTTMIMIMICDHGNRPLTKSKCIHFFRSHDSKQQTNEYKQCTRNPNRHQQQTLEGEAEEATKRRKRTNRKQKPWKKLTTFNWIQQNQAHHNFGTKNPASKKHWRIPYRPCPSRWLVSDSQGPQFG